MDWELSSLGLIFSSCPFSIFASNSFSPSHPIPSPPLHQPLQTGLSLWGALSLPLGWPGSFQGTLMDANVGLFQIVLQAEPLICQQASLHGLPVLRKCKSPPYRHLWKKPLQNGGTEQVALKKKRRHSIVTLGKGKHIRLHWRVKEWTQKGVLRKEWRKWDTAANKEGKEEWLAKDGQTEGTRENGNQGRIKKLLRGQNKSKSLTKTGTKVHLETQRERQEEKWL